MVDPFFHIIPEALTDFYRNIVNVTNSELIHDLSKTSHAHERNRAVQEKKKW